MLCIGKCSLWPEKFTCSLCVYLWIRLAFFLHWKNHSLHIIHYTSKFACRHFHWNFHHQPNCIRLERDCRWTKTVYSNKLNVCTFIYLFASVVGWRVLFVLENCKIDKSKCVFVFFGPQMELLSCESPPKLFKFLFVISLMQTFSFREPMCSRLLCFCWMKFRIACAMVCQSINQIQFDANKHAIWTIYSWAGNKSRKFHWLYTFELFIDQNDSEIN